MNTKVYQLNGAIIIEAPNKDKVYLNTDDARLVVSGNVFMINDAQTNKAVELDIYSRIESGDGTTFQDFDSCYSYLLTVLQVTGSPLSLQTGGMVSNTNPLPSLDIDAGGRVSRNTVFGDKITAKRIPQIAAQFQYPLAADDVKPPVTVNGGSVTQENALLKLSTSNQVGSSIILQSTATIRYIPGFECYLYATPDFNDPVSGQTQFMGVFDDNTGFGFGYNGNDFVFIHRRDGVDSYHVIDISAFSSQYGYTLNPQKGNIYLLTYGFLGYAPAKLEIVPPWGGLLPLFTLEYPNSADQTHISQTFLPIRGELNNNTGSTPMTVSLGSVNAGIVNGGDESIYTFSRDFNYFTPTDITVSGNTEIVGFKNKDLFGGITNYVSARLFNFNAAVSLNKNCILAVIKDPTMLNTPTWNDVDTDSVLQYSTDIQVDFTNIKTYYTRPLFSTGAFDADVEAHRYDLPPGHIAVFAILTTGAGDVRFSNYWKELF